MIKKIIFTSIASGVIVMAFLIIMLMASLSMAITDESGFYNSQDAEVSEDYGGIYSGGRFTWPVPGVTYISSDYGPRICPYHGVEIHSGIDIAGSAGKAVVAAEDGKVVLAGWNGSYGKCVIISHGSGLYTLYGHLSVISTNNGSNISAGKQIGKVGSTGNSTGPHLHFEVRKGANSYSNHTSPWPYLKK